MSRRAVGLLGGARASAPLAAEGLGWRGASAGLARGLHASCRSSFHSSARLARAQHLKPADRGEVETDPMIHELRRIEIQPNQMHEFIACTADAIPTKQEQGAKLIGYWTTEFGEPKNSIVQIWEYSSFKQREEVRSKLANNSKWRKYAEMARPMLQKDHATIITPFDFWPLHYPEAESGIYELRTYRLNPGNVWVWASYWEQGLKHRSKYVQPVGAWYSEIGVLNRVFHLWQYPDMDKRKQLRESAWNEPGWAEVVEFTHPLIQTMESCILKPTPFSPLK
ncbi:NIPSNAP domain-containing protein [Balamuthia mandrillaris]